MIAKAFRCNGMGDILALIVDWTRIKLRLQVRQPKPVHYREREIWWVHVGANLGSEQNGKNAGFDRPVLILRVFTADLFWGIPFTTRSHSGTYYYATSCAIGQKQQIAMLHQARVMSSRRLIKKQRTLPQDEFDELRNAVKNLI